MLIINNLKRGWFFEQQCTIMPILGMKHFIYNIYAENFLLKLIGRKGMY